MKGTKRKKSTDNVGSCKQRVGSQRKVGKKNKWTANSISDLVHHLEASVTSPTLIERDAPLTEREEKYLNSSKDPIAEVWKLSKRDLCGFFGLMGPEVYSKFYVRDKLNESDKLYLSDILRERVQEVRENLKVIKRVEMVLIRDYQNQDLLKEHKRQKEWVQVVIDLLRDFDILHHFTLSLCGRLFRLSFRIEHQETVVKSSYCYYFCIEEIGIGIPSKVFCNCFWKIFACADFLLHEFSRILFRKAVVFKKLFQFFIVQFQESFF